MKYLFLFLSIFGVNQALFAQDWNKDQIYLADPTIFVHKGTYYLYGTKGNSNITGEGFLVYTSLDLKHWEGPKGVSEGFALKKGDAFGTKGFWAPQVFGYQDKFYMAYTANEHIAIASSDSPLGPFKNEGRALKNPVRQIDPFVFFDKGKIYLYHVRLTKGNRIFVAEMNADLKGIKPETLNECIVAEKKTWENTVNSDWPVSEGPTVIKKGAKYILLYSANDFRNPDYAVGFATSESPLGPWKKSPSNPIISKKKTGRNGIGHGDIFFVNNEQMNYVLHTHFSNNMVSPRKTGIIRLKFFKNQEGLKARPKTFHFLKKTVKQD